MTNRVAVLVDGDNISASFADQILGCGKSLGRVDVARVYAGAGNPSQWLTITGFRYLHAGAGKNAADLLLTIDAMELACGPAPETFVIASSDGDFTHLALRLREKGVHVCGIGEPKAPHAFRAACSEFVQVVGRLAEAEKPAYLAFNPPVALSSDLDRHIRAVIALHSKKGQGMRLADLGPKIHSAHGINISTLPDSTWRNYLAKRPDLYELDPRGPDAMVRFRPAGFAALP